MHYNKLQNNTDNELNSTTSKTIRFDNELIVAINDLRKGTERDFSAQVRFMLKEYIRFKNG